MKGFIPKSAILLLAPLVLTSCIKVLYGIEIEEVEFEIPEFYSTTMEEISSEVCARAKNLQGEVDIIFDDLIKGGLVRKVAKNREYNAATKYGYP